MCTCPFFHAPLISAVVLFQLRQPFRSAPNFFQLSAVFHLRQRFPTKATRFSRLSNYGNHFLAFCPHTTGLKYTSISLRKTVPQKPRFRGFLQLLNHSFGILSVVVKQKNTPKKYAFFGTRFLVLMSRFRNPFSILSKGDQGDNAKSNGAQF